MSGRQILGFYLISILLGCLVGLFGTAFQVFSDWLGHCRVDFSSWLLVYHLPGYVGPMIFSGLSVALSAYLVLRFSPEAAGSGVQEIEGALLAKRPIFWRRLLPTKFFAGALSIGANMVVGREGPTIQMGGNLGEMLGEKLGLAREKRNILIGAGAAGGLATAFNAPLAGIVFILEEMREHFRFSFVSFKSVALCCVMATIVLRTLLGQQSDIQMPLFQAPNLNVLMTFFVFGIVIGCVGLCFNVFLMRTLDWVDLIRGERRVTYALLIGVLVGFLTWFFPGSVGGGYAILSQAIKLSYTTQFLLFLFLLRFITTLVCYSSGVPGGLFAPMLALGTLLGVAFGQAYYAIVGGAPLYADMFAVAGMGALFAACIRAPVTGIILIVEMTQNYLLILPSMVTCLVATTIVQLANNPPIYNQLLKRTLSKALPSQ